MIFILTISIIKTRAFVVNSDVKIQSSKVNLMVYGKPVKPNHVAKIIALKVGIT